MPLSEPNPDEDPGDSNVDPESLPDPPEDDASSSPEPPESPRPPDRDDPHPTPAVEATRAPMAASAAKLNPFFTASLHALMTSDAAPDQDVVQRGRARDNLFVRAPAESWLRLASRTE